MSLILLVSSSLIYIVFKNVVLEEFDIIEEEFEFQHLQLFHFLDLIQLILGI